MSPLVVTTKLLSVPPREFSKTDDHLGCNKLTWWPIGPTGGFLNDFSCWIALRSMGIFSWNPERLAPPSLSIPCRSVSACLASAFFCCRDTMADFTSASASCTS